MKKLILLIVFVGVTLFKSYCQDFPDFGMPSKEEIELKECPFEKEAAAVILIHEAFSYSEDDQRLVTTHHIKIKILKQSGVNVADVSIPFIRFNSFEKITGLEALTLNIADDGSIIKQKVGKKLFYTSKINELKGEINFAFPSVKAGSIIEYQYRSVMLNYWGLRDWYFQSNIPVITSRYHLKSIFTKRFSYKVFKSPGIDITVLPEHDRIFFEMRNIPSLTAEPYMDAKEDYLQRVNFIVGNYNSRWQTNQVRTYESSWPALNSEMLFNKFFGRQILSTINGTTGFIDSVKLLKSEEEKMNIIYNHVKNRMTWNNINDFLSDDVNEMWKKGIGSSGDINMILMNLLNEAQLDVYPLLVSKRFNGTVDSTYPNVDQFNSLQACVVINHKKYILDATEKDYTSNMIPESVLNTTAFMIDRIKGELINIKTDLLKYKETINLNILITEDGFMKGMAFINNLEYAKIEKYGEYKKDTVKYKERYFQQKDILLAINKFEILNAVNDSLPLTEKFEFSSNLNSTGDYKFIPINLFTGFDKNPFLSDNRFSNINFGYNRTINLNAVIKVPENYTIDGVPANHILDLDEKEIAFSTQTDFNKTENTIYYKLTIEFKKNFYESVQYSVIKEKYKKLFNLLSEKIVLKIK